MKLVWDYENSAKKVAPWKNHLHFKLHCKHHDVTPTSLRLASNIRGEKADKKAQKHAEVKFHEQNKFKGILDKKCKKKGDLVESKDTLA